MADLNKILKNYSVDINEQNRKEWEEIVSTQIFTPISIMQKISNTDGLDDNIKIRFYACLIFPPCAKTDFNMNLIDLNEVNLYGNQVRFIEMVEKSNDRNFSLLIDLICESLPSLHNTKFDYNNHIVSLYHILVAGCLEKSYPEISIRSQKIRNKILVFIQKHIERMLSFVVYGSKDDFFDVYFLLNRIICDTKYFNFENKKWAHSVIQERILLANDDSCLFLRSYLSTMILAYKAHEESKSIFSNFDSYIEFIITNSNKMKNNRYNTFYFEQIEVIKFISKQELKLKVLKFFVWDNDGWPINKNLFVLGGDPLNNEYFFGMEEEVRSIVQNDPKLLNDMEILFINHNKSKTKSV